MSLSFCGLIQAPDLVTEQFWGRQCGLGLTGWFCCWGSGLVMLAGLTEAELV